MWTPCLEPGAKPSTVTITCTVGSIPLPTWTRTAVPEIPEPGAPAMSACAFRTAGARLPPIAPKVMRVPRRQARPNLIIGFMWFSLLKVELRLSLQGRDADRIRLTRRSQRPWCEMLQLDVALMGARRDAAGTDVSDTYDFASGNASLKNLIPPDRI